MSAAFSPSIDDPLALTEQAIAKRLTRIMAWTGISIGGLAIPTILLVAPQEWMRLLLGLTAAALGALSLRLLRRGSIGFVAGLLVWGYWSVMAVAGVLHGGVVAPAMIISLMLAAFSALVFGLRYGMAVCAANALLCILLVVYERSGHTWPASPPEFRASLIVMMSIMTTFLLWSTASMLRSAALLAHAESAQRAAAERLLSASREELRAANAELEARVAVRTAQLAEANRELEAFSYSVAHDLRAPLRVIDGFSSDLEATLALSQLADARRDVEQIRSACRHMSQQIDGLLRLASLTRTEPDCRPIDLSGMAASVVETLRQAHRGRDVQVDIEPGISVHGDPEQMRVVLENLLGNAWKYTARTPAARIHFGSAMVDGARAVFVRDNGAGFDMAQADKLFTAFQRLHEEHEFEGHGIGLATVQRIVNRHGGRIWAESAVGKGATFWFVLPPAPARSLEHGAAVQPQAREGGPR